MAAAIIGSTGIVLEELTKDNYLNWSVLVKNYLIGKELWYNVVEGNLNLDHPDWKSKNGQALHAIQLSCGNYTIQLIRNFETAQEAWNYLKDFFSEDSKADHHDIERGSLQSEIDMFHMAIKKSYRIDEVNHYLTRHGEDIISQKSPSSSKGWTSLHVAVDAGKTEIMKELVKKGALLTEKDSEGYTPFALAAESGIVIDSIEWMLNEGGNELLTMKINSDDDKGHIPVLLAAINGHREVTRFLFSKTDRSILLDNNCYYGAKLLSHCIHAEIFDVAAKLLQLQHDDGTQIPLSYESDQCMRPIHALAHIPTAFLSGTKLNGYEQRIYNDVAAKLLQLQHDDGTQIPLSYESDQCMRPIHALAHIPTAFLSGTKLNGYEQRIYNVLQIPLDHEGKVITNESQRYRNSTCIALGITRLYHLKKEHYIVREILRCFCERIEKIPLESELNEWSVHDAMLQAAKYGIIEFINSMRKANPDLLWAMDKNKRGIFAHAILNRQYEVFNLIFEIEGQNWLKTSTDKFGNNILHHAAELGPSFYHRRKGSNAASIMQREHIWFKVVESIVPPVYKQAKNVHDLKPRELFTKNHEQLLNDGRQSVKETANSFTIVGTLIIAIMFAAAFTVPGGNDQNKGTPTFLGQNAFSIFIIFDALSLGASSSAVLIFTGILASNYTEEDFIKTLPLKLLAGISTIFISLACMMCAFCAALSLILKGYNSIMVTAIVFSVLPIYDIFGTTSLVKEFFFLIFASDLLRAMANTTTNNSTDLIAFFMKWY